MNALRTSLLMLALTFTACGPADAFVEGENDGTMDTESELAATTGRFETFTGKDGQTYFHSSRATARRCSRARATRRCRARRPASSR